MEKEDIEFSVIKNTIGILAVLCASNSEQIIDLLTGHLWDEEEAGSIKRASGEYTIK